MRYIQKWLLMFVVLVLMSTAVSYGDGLQYQTVTAASVKSMNDVVQKGEGPFIITGALVIGNSDGTKVSDSVFSYSRYKTPGPYNTFEPGTFFFSLDATDAISQSGRYLVDYELGLYKKGKLLRTIWCDRPLVQYQMTTVFMDTPVVDYDTVKYTCRLYKENQLGSIPKSYPVERVSLTNDLPKIVSELKNAYGFGYWRWTDEGPEDSREYTGLYLNEDRYADAGCPVYFPNKHINTAKASDTYSFKFSNDSVFLSYYDDAYDVNQVEALPKETTFFYSSTRDSFAELKLYKQASNNRGYVLDKVLLINGKFDSLESQEALVRSESKVITFDDPNFEAVIRESISKQSGPICEYDVKDIWQIQAQFKNIRSIEGIQALKNLRYLTIGNNKITDISPLARLTNLTDVSISDNQITDISPLASLKKLNRLDFYSNKVHDVSPLRDLPQLQSVMWFNNPINDESPVTDRSDVNVYQP